MKACPGLVSGGFEGEARLKQIGLFEMRRLEMLSNTIFGVAMTLLAYDLPKASSERAELDRPAERLPVQARGTDALQNPKGRSSRTMVGFSTDYSSTSQHKLSEI
jgi:hypothetical protein